MDRIYAHYISNIISMMKVNGGNLGKRQFKRNCPVVVVG